MKCTTKTCDKEATGGYVWPGRATISASCLPCLLRAQTIAGHMGFRLEITSRQELEEELASDSINRLKGAGV